VVVDRPRRARADPHLEVVGADELDGEVPDELVGEVGRTRSRVIAPDEHPHRPRLDHPEHAEPDAVVVRARLEHPVKDGRAVGDEPGQVGLEDDAQGAGHGARALERQAQVRGDLAACAVRAHDVA